MCVEMDNDVSYLGEMVSGEEDDMDFLLMDHFRCAKKV